MHFWSIKGVYILLNSNNLNFKLYIDRKYSIFRPKLTTRFWISTSEKKLFKFSKLGGGERLFGQNPKEQQIFLRRLDSIAASLFVLNWLSWQTVSDDKIQVTILILRRGALSNSDPPGEQDQEEPLSHWRGRGWTRAEDAGTYFWNVSFCNNGWYSSVSILLWEFSKHWSGCWQNPWLP